ncbi:MAG: transporter substrate-binding domain-containing protein [Pseudomonadota bacterium]
MQRMLRVGAILLWTAMLPALAAAPVVTVTGHPNWPPFSWQSGDRIVGIGADLAELVFSDIGLDVVSKSSGNWKRARAQAEFGAVDVLVAAYRTPERQHYLAYPETPFMEDVNVVWVRDGKAFPFRKWDDLVGRRGTAMLGESYGEAFDHFITQRLTMEWVSTPSQSLQKLAMGRVVYYPFSVHGGKIQVKQLNFSGRIVNLPHPILTENIYLAISKKSPYARYLPQIEAAIAARRADGSIERLIRKHTP